MVATMSDKKVHKRTYKTRSIADVARGINGRAFRRFGFAKSDIVLHWDEIVGSVLARSSLPERLIMPKKNKHSDDRGGVLKIRVEGSFAPEMQHLEPLVIDRINSYYGFKAVERLTFYHGVVSKNTPERKYRPPILSDSKKKELDSILEEIKDDNLRKSLYAVGAELMGSHEPEKVKQIKRFTRRGKGST